ncbi:Nn.00g034970.m01.CDS01 [Neocucurbitaria sp. VM-36]
MITSSSRRRQVLVYLGEEDLGFGSRDIWLDESKRLSALKQLFAKRWVSRVWVIQEVALARRVMMITGDVECHWTADLLSRIRGRARACGLQTPGPLAWDPVVNASTRDLLTMLHISRNCLSTDPRDKIYGLLGLTGERLQSLIKVDYSQSVEEVLTLAAGAIIICREDLDILAYASSSLGVRHTAKRLPTWVPDWEEHHDDTTVRPQFQSFEVGPWRSLKKMSGIKRIYLDTLDWTEVVHIPPNWRATSVSEPYVTIRAHCIGEIDGISRQTEGRMAQWPSPRCFSDQLTMLMKGDVDPPSWPSEFQWLLTYVRSPTPESDHKTLLPVDETDLTSFCSELTRLGDNKCLFRAGYLPAVASACFEEGDTVWAVDGCTIPLILRHVEGPKYRILGNCQLFGLWHLDCWNETGSGDKRQWHFDPFRRMDARGTQFIEIY